jgi:hypothetical protein
MTQQLLLQPRPLEIIAYVRKLRGGSQAQLIQADDGNFYAIKAKNNPQHRRILINEWFAAAFYNAAGLPVADTAVVNISPECLVRFPQLRLHIGSSAHPLSCGPSFGSRWITDDPMRCDVFDFVPDDLLRRIDTSPFVGALVADQWLCQADSRQAAFSINQGQTLFRFIDNGFIWNGPHWELMHAFCATPYHARVVYSNMSESTIADWIDTVRHLRFDLLFEHARNTMPDEWLAPGEEQDLKHLQRKLKERLAKLAIEVETALRALHKTRCF